MTHRVHAAMHHAQAPVGDPAIDPLAVDAGREQLPSSDSAVPALGDRDGDVEFTPHMRGQGDIASKFAPHIRANVGLTPDIGVKTTRARVGAGGGASA